MKNNVYKDVIVDKRNYDNVIINNPIPVFIGHDVTKIIGFAVCRYTKEGVKADITTKNKIEGLYPSIGFVINKIYGDNVKEIRLINIGMSNQKNQDPTKTLIDKFIKLDQDNEY